MLRRTLLLAALLGLAACQNLQIDSDYDPARDFAALHTWSWQEPAVQYRPQDPRLSSDLTEQRLRQAIAAQLERRGLRPAAAGTPGDLQVQSFVIVDQRHLQEISSYPGGFAGPYWNGGWAAAGMTQVRNLDYQVGTLQIDLRDRAGQLVWRGSAAQTLPRDPGTPQQRTAAIRATVAQILAKYPPRR